MIEYKTKKEIAKMEMAGKLTAEILFALCVAAKPGISTLDLDILAVREMKKRNVESVFLNYQPGIAGGKSFPANICTSVNEEIVHGIPKKEAVLKEGDILSIDIATKHDGYVGDTATTIGIGKISESSKRLLKIGEQSVWEGILQSFPGKRLGDVGHAIESYLSSRSLHVVRKFFGHGIGRQMHEEPMIPHYGEPNQGLLIEEGFVYTIEPMICQNSGVTKCLDDGWTVTTEDNSIAAHFEHTIAITKTGPQILTKL